MRANWLKRALTAALLLIVVIFLTTPRTVAALEFVDHFNNLDNWTFYRGQESKNGMIDNTQYAQPAPNPPSLKLPPARSLQPDPPGFGDDVVSLYLSNPDTSKLANFTLTFWIHFDDTVGRGGRAIVTFRMQDWRNYYAVYLSDDVSWTSRIDKFIDDHEKILNQTKTQGVFSSNSWSKVRLEVRGSIFNLYKDDSPILTASDGQWAAGMTLGLGIYNGFNTFSFHVEEFDLETCESLCYVSMLTQESTVSTTTSLTITEKLTSIITAVSTTTSTSTQVIVNPVISNVVSYNTTFVSAYVPIMDYPTLAFLLAVGFVLGVINIREYEKGVMAVLATVICGLVIAYVFYLREGILPYLGYFATALFAGVLVKFARRWEKQTYHNNDSKQES